MKQYHIFRDSALVERETSRRRAVEKIRKMQGSETHYLLRSEFSIIHGEEEIISQKTDVARNAPEYRSPLAAGERYHILKDGTQYGVAPTHELALLMIQQAQERRASAVFTIVRGIEEFIRYPKRRAKQL